MSDPKPFGGMDPNSTHQLWSRWQFGIKAHASKRPNFVIVAENARVYFKKLFGVVGRARCDQQDLHYLVTCEIEGPPAHDPDYVERVKQDFIERFMRQGFGPSARLERFEVMVLAGSKQDGQPADQLLVMPHFSVTKLLADERERLSGSQTLGMPHAHTTKIGKIGVQ